MVNIEHENEQEKRRQKTIIFHFISLAVAELIMKNYRCANIKEIIGRSFSCCS